MAIKCVLVPKAVPGNREPTAFDPGRVEGQRLRYVPAWTARFETVDATMGEAGAVGELKPLSKGWRRHEGKCRQAFYEHRRLKRGSENSLVLLGEGCGAIAKVGRHWGAREA